MSEYFIKHFEYLKTLSYEDLEKCNVDWNAARVGFNYKDKILKYNPPLREEEFEKEKASSYRVKKYNYNYRDESELTEENLKQTFANIIANGYFLNMDKTMRKEDLNLDSINTKEREELLFSLKQRLDTLGEIPLHNDSFFSKIKNTPGLLVTLIPYFIATILRYLEKEYVRAFAKSA